MPEIAARRIDIGNELNDIWTTWFRNLDSAFIAYEATNGKFSPKHSRFDSAYERLEEKLPLSLRHVVVESVFRDRNDPNSLSAAESLLCVLFPADSIDGFSLVDTSPFACARSLKPVNQLSGTGNTGAKSFDERSLVKLLAVWGTFMVEYSDSNGKATFRASSYLEPISDSGLTDDQRDQVDVLDSYTFSVTLCLLILSILRRWSQSGGETFIGQPSHIELLEDVREVTSQRLTAALVGLCAGFSIDVPVAGEWEENTRLRWNEEAMAPVRRRLNAVLGDTVLQQNAGKPFEIGWTWSQTEVPVGLPDGVNAGDYLDLSPAVWPQAAPYFYFTLATMDGLTDLFADRVQTEELLNGTQLFLAGRLRLLSDLATQYWRLLATESERWLYSRQEDKGVGRPGRMALEALPWRTGDGDSSDLWSVFLVGVLLNEMLTNRISFQEPELARLRRLLQELAERGRLVREPVTIRGIDGTVIEDPAVRHFQIDGKKGQLWGRAVGNENEDEPIFNWPMLDFATQVFKRSSQLSKFIRDWDELSLLDALTSDIWNLNLRRRRMSSVKREVAAVEGWHEAFWLQRRYLWDDPSGLLFTRQEMFSGLAWMESVSSEGAELSGARYQPTECSWYMTERIVESLVARELAERRNRVQNESLMLLFESLRESLLGSIPSERRGEFEATLSEAQDHARRGEGAIALAAVLDSAAKFSSTLKIEQSATRLLD